MSSSAQDKSEHGSPDQQREHSPRVLFVDDNEFSCMIAGVALNAAGFRVEIARTFAAGRAIIDTAYDNEGRAVNPIDIIVSDGSIQGETEPGQPFQAIRWMAALLRERGIETPLIAQSAAGDVQPDDINWQGDSNMFVSLPKPWSPNAMVGTVIRLVQACSVNQAASSAQLAERLA